MGWSADMTCVRGILKSWDAQHLEVSTDQGLISVAITDSTLVPLLYQDMQLNLLDCRLENDCLVPTYIIVEPDFLVDVSSIAACFTEHGHHANNYLQNRLKPHSNTQAILLGQFASTALDYAIHHPGSTVADTLRATFRQQILQFCTCDSFNGKRFKSDAQLQQQNIQQAVDVLFTNDFHREKVLIEPSFICEKLGLQGRVDLMTSDFRLLVEQKSGRAHQSSSTTPLYYRESHYVQLLLYYGIMHYNFGQASNGVDIRLLYSKYPAYQGLMRVGFHKDIFAEALRLRNQIVAQEMRIAREGFGVVRHLVNSLQSLSAEENAYVERMLSFVYREQLAQKVGTSQPQPGVQVGAQADLWHMSLAEKLDNGNIIMGVMQNRTADSITLSIDTSATLPNFRRGDMICLYHYDGEPDVRNHILYKGVVQELSDTNIVLHLNDGQQNPTVFQEGTYAVEHAASDIGSTSSIRAIMSLCYASSSRRSLLMGLRAPRCDESLTLSHSYHPHFDEILLRSKQARDFFLLQGPPGTGKTSMALRFLVQEELQASVHILLTAYTNRAVDEICSMLTDAGVDYLRLGSETSCDPRFAHRLLDNMMGEQPRLAVIKQYLQQVSVVVATTSTLQSRPFIFQINHFSLCIVDEASQILEPSIIGLLASDAIERFILIGDHKQLPAVVQQPDDEPRLHDCRLSLFERLLKQERQAQRTAFTGILRHQGRMHPDIAQFPNEFFYQREQLECVPCQHQLERSLDYNEPSEDTFDELLKQHRVLFLPSQTLPSWLPPVPVDHVSSSDKANATEARIVADLLRRIMRQYGHRFDPDKTVGVIVPYRNQIAMIRRELSMLGLPQLLDISIDTVERYQGSQRDVIIYSFTVTQSYQLDFLTSTRFEESGRLIDRKLNVAMTRARKQLLMTGHVPTLCQDELFAELIRRYPVVY